MEQHFFRHFRLFFQFMTILFLTPLNLFFVYLIPSSFLEHTPK